MIYNNKSEEIQMAFYISNTGSDSNKGTLEQPFRSIEKAQQEVRKINAHMTGNIVVYLREGTYNLSKTLEFCVNDSGTNGYNVIYKAFEEEAVIISGGKKITNWQKVSFSNVPNLWVAEVEDLEYTRHFYVNGKSAARTKGKQAEALAWDVLKDPNMIFHNQLETVKTHQGEYSVFEGYLTTYEKMTTWQNQRDIEFVYDVGWTHAICPVDSITSVSNGAFVKMRMPCFRDCQIKGGVNIGSPSYIENAFELLTEPGEWYFNRATRKIYYIPRSDEDMEQVEAIAPVIEKLIELKGTLDMPVHDIQFIGMAFTYTTFLRPSILGHAEAQANLTKDPDEDLLLHSAFLKTPSSIVLDSAESIVFDGCDFRMLGSGGIDIQNGSKNNKICGNRFLRIAASGVQIGDFTVRDAHPEDERVIVKDNVISNNYFNDIGTDLKGSVAVIVGYTEGTVIAHNDISNIAYSGISVGWGWGYFDVGTKDRFVNKAPESYNIFDQPTIAKGNRIEYNYIHHVMQKLHDGAGIYTLSMQAGSAIKGNLIHDNGEIEPGYGAIPILWHKSGRKATPEAEAATKLKGFPGGIYQDEASGGFEVTGNIVYNVAIPYFYHEVEIEGRFETNNIHDNYFNVKPEDRDYPITLADKAGLESVFRYLKN